MTNRASDKISLLQYAFMALPLSFAGLPLYIHAPDFYTRDLGLSIGALGLILLAIRLLDAVQDPVIGYLSDIKSHQRFAIMGLGLVTLVLGFAGLFYGPQFSVPVPVWFAFFMVAATTGFSMVSINLNMIGGFWKNSSGDRARISSAREGLGLVGLLLAALLPTLLQRSVSAELSFIILFWVFALLIIVAAVLFARFMRKVSIEGTKQQATDSSIKSKFSFFRILLGPDRMFFAICFLAQFAASVPAVLVMFFMRDYLGADAYAGMFLMIYFLSGAALMGLWIKLSDRYGMYYSWLISMVLSIATFAWAYLLQPGDLAAYGFICALSGMALGADLALPPAIIANRINAQKTERQATQYYAIQSFLPKVSMALAGGLSFTVLGFIGFEAGAENSPAALHGLVAVYALLPCLIKIISAIFLFYLIQKEEHHNEKTERSTTHGTTRNFRRVRRRRWIAGRL